MSDNIDRWKSRDGKSQRREEKRREEKRREEKRREEKRREEKRREEKRREEKRREEKRREEKRREEKRREEKRREEKRREEKRREEKRREEKRREEKRREEKRREEKRREEKRREEKRREEKRREEKRREERREKKEERRKKKEERRKKKEERRKKKEDPGARKGRKVAKHCVFPVTCGSGGSKSRLPKAAGAEPADKIRDEKLHAVVVRSAFPSQNVQSTPRSESTFAKHVWKSKCKKKTPQPRSAFGSSDVEKVHAVVARSTFGSQKRQKLTGCSEHFWKLKCWEGARRCGVKHMSKSKCRKHTILRQLLEVDMSKKYTLLWCEAHFEVKMCKAHQPRITFWS